MIRFQAFILATALALVTARPTFTEPIISRSITLTTGTAVRVASLPTRANSIFIQSRAGNTALVYVLYADLGTTCALTTAGQLVAELGIGSSTSPGSSFSFPSNGSASTQGGGVDVSRFCVAGTTSDQVLVAYDQRQ